MSEVAARGLRRFLGTAGGPVSLSLLSRTVRGRADVDARPQAARSGQRAARGTPSVQPSDGVAVAPGRRVGVGGGGGRAPERKGREFGRVRKSAAEASTTRRYLSGSWHRSPTANAVCVAATRDQARKRGHLQGAQMGWRGPSFHNARMVSSSLSGIRCHNPQRQPLDRPRPKIAPGRGAPGRMECVTVLRTSDQPPRWLRICWGGRRTRR